MPTRVRIITEEAPAIVLSYPREADPVFGADFTEIAQLPAHFEQEFTVNPGIDLLVAEMPLAAAAGDGADDGAGQLAKVADASDRPTGSASGSASRPLHEAA